MKKHTMAGSAALAAGLAAGALALLPTPRPVAAEPAGSASKPATPMDELGLFLDAFHVRDGHPDEQMEAAHYCGQVSPDLHQCALFDGAGPDAKLIGIEYVITAGALEDLPEQERGLWHSHAYEVTSGQLVAPRMSPDEEHALMKTLAGTYGKTWHTWQVHKGDAVPLGRPSLMMSFTKEGQARPELIRERDTALGISTDEVRTRRTDIEPPPLLPGVDRGEDGRSCRAFGAPPHGKGVKPQAPGR